MATETVIDPTERTELTFTAASGLYDVASEASATDALDQLNARSSQLAAMLQVIVGEGSDSFSRYSEGIQHDYLWGCASLATEIEQLLRVHAELSAKEGGHA